MHDCDMREMTTQEAQRYYERLTALIERRRAAGEDHVALLVIRARLRVEYLDGARP